MTNKKKHISLYMFERTIDIVPDIIPHNTAILSSNIILN